MNNAWTIFRINGALRGNKLIYWLGRLPLIRRLFTDRLYSAGEGKLALTILQALWWALPAGSLCRVHSPVNRSRKVWRLPHHPEYSRPAFRQ